MGKIKSGWYDFFKCPKCKKDSAITNLDHQYENIHCPHCGVLFDSDDNWIGQEMIETGEN